MSVRVAMKIPRSDGTLGPFSGAASFTTYPVMVAYDRSLSLTILWTSTLSGTFVLQCCDTVDGTYVDVPGASAEFASKQPNGANAGTQEYNWSQMPGKFWRLSYTAASGSGDFTIAGTQGDIIQC